MRKLRNSIRRSPFGRISSRESFGQRGVLLPPLTTSGHLVTFGWHHFVQLRIFYSFVKSIMAPKKDQRHRAWTFTVNNYTDDDIECVHKLKDFARYVTCGKEVGASGTPHLQGFVYFVNKQTMKAVSRVLPRARLDVAKGNDFENFAYTTKEGDVLVVHGRAPCQGARGDLEELRDEVVKGLSVDDIALENPHMYHQFGRTLSRIEDIVMRRKFRTEMTEGIWYYGYTGGGKSHIAFTGYTPETHYVYPTDKGWWDGYKQQDVVIFNDFRGELPYSYILQLVDKWPFSVSRRGREPLPFLSKKVIVTSALRPEEVYRNLAARDTLSQLLRRFEVIEVFPPAEATAVAAYPPVPFLHEAPQALSDNRASPLGERNEAERSDAW